MVHRLTYSAVSPIGGTRRGMSDNGPDSLAVSNEANFAATKSRRSNRCREPLAISACRVAVAMELKWGVEHFKSQIRSASGGIK
jgi:hypothetical protein